MVSLEFEPGPQDGRRRQIHCAMMAAQQTDSLGLREKNLILPIFFFILYLLSNSILNDIIFCTAEKRTKIKLWMQKVT